MARILADQRRLIREGERWRLLGQQLENQKGQVIRLNRQLRSKLKSRDRLGYHINTLSERLEKIGRDALALEKLLEELERTYRLAETEAASWAEEMASMSSYRELLSLAGPPVLGNFPEEDWVHVLVEDNESVKREAASWQWGPTGEVGYDRKSESDGHGGKSGNDGDDGKSESDGHGGTGVWAEAGIWGRETKAADLGASALFGTAASEHGWAARGEAKGIWGPLSLEGFGETVSWEVGAETGYGGPLLDGWGGSENSLAWLPQGYASAGLSVSGLMGGLEATFLGENTAISIGGNGALGYAEAVFDAEVGRQPDGSFGVSKQFSLEAGAVKGEAKAGFTLWGIRCSLGLEGKADAVGVSGGYEVSTERLRWNIGAALGVGLEINVELDWSEFQMPEQEVKY